MKRCFLIPLVLVWCARMPAVAQVPPGGPPMLTLARKLQRRSMRHRPPRRPRAETRGRGMRAQRYRESGACEPNPVRCTGAAQLQGSARSGPGSVPGCAWGPGSGLCPGDRRLPRSSTRTLRQHPRGEALARFNAGDEVGALAILDGLRAGRDKARQKRAEIESAAEGRAHRQPALERHAPGVS